MKLDGTDLKAHGLVAYGVKGAFDMPQRKSPYVYDWGDEYQPLFGPNYTAYTERKITIDFLYDPRIQSIGTPGVMYPETFAQAYLDASPHVLEMDNAVNGIGVFNGHIQNIANHKVYKGQKAKITLSFSETNPEFNGALPTSKNGGTTSIDGYGLQQFGIIVSKTNGLAGLGEAVASKNTTNLLNPTKRLLRSLHSFTLECYMVSSNPIVQMASFQKVLTQQKVLPFIHGGYSFNVICVSGFQVTRKKTGALKFNLNLTRI